MHDFKYRGPYLYAEDTRLIELAKKAGTPAYVYSRKSFHSHFSKLDKAFEKVPHLICYSLKANCNFSILRLLAEWGAGADIVSGGELYRALRAGIKPEKIVYAGVGKSEYEIAYAIRKGILLFNVESLPELLQINKVALSLGRVPKVCLRINPDITPYTHRYLTTAKKETKFGISIPRALEIFSNRIKWPGVHIVGLHVHLGSQITDISPYEKAVKKLTSFIKEELEPRGIILEFFNLGGGLGIVYDKETPSTALNFSRKILPLLKGIKVKLILEPGRFIAGNSGILLTRVLYIKNGKGKKFAVVDSGMNDLLRPALYGAYHDINPLILKNGKREKVDIVGPICESGDFLAKDRLMEELRAGDFIAIMSTGAYGFTMSSNYNSRPRAPEVLVNGKDFRIVRRRETYKDLIRPELV
jgi:diaminopimelate decarboxylase